ncbi:MAG: aspartate ammonia-lyase [Lentisphaeria bacterium]|nr:aspartate ammonia-lyase [Lentisphaeria bacterium]
MKRKEHDSLGEREIADKNYFGIQTVRAIENFQITSLTLDRYPHMINGLALTKKAAALANRDLGVLEEDKAEAIIKACEEILEGELHDQFPIDMIQGGAGTSVNMNANEVIANRALEILGYPKGRYDIIHPNNHVNCSQSTNDVYPTAFRVALINNSEELIIDIHNLAEALKVKGDEFEGILKMGRTQLQDAVPMSLGDEFRGFANNLREEVSRTQNVQVLMSEINLGATAIGTTVNAPSGYPVLATNHLAELTGLPLTLAPDLIEATSDTGAYVQMSSMLKRFAIKLSKICNDLRLLSSGPRAGLNEINLPPRQPGSSIMPGKVNPVIPEVVNQIAYQVIGTDVTITLAAEAGQLQLNVMEPVIAFNLFNNMLLLSRACRTLQSLCIEGITANEEVCNRHVMNSIGIVTALNPSLGYEKCSEIAKEALKRNVSVHQIAVVEQNLITEEEWAEIFSKENMLHPKFIVQGKETIHKP